MQASRLGTKWFARQLKNKTELARYYDYENFLGCRAEQAVREDDCDGSHEATQSYVLCVLETVAPESVLLDLYYAIREYAEQHPEFFGIGL